MSHMLPVPRTAGMEGWGDRGMEEMEEEEEEGMEEKGGPSRRGGPHRTWASPGSGTALLHPVISRLQPRQVLHLQRGKQAEQQRWLRRAQQTSMAVKQDAQQQKDANYQINTAEFPRIMINGEGPGIDASHHGAPSRQRGWRVPSLPGP